MRAWMVGTALGLLLMGAGVAADNLLPTPRSRAEADQRLSDLTKRQYELAATYQDQARRVESLWLNETLTSPEIVALRRRLAELRRQASETEAELRQQVLALPEAQTEVRRGEQLKAEYRALGEEIERLRARRNTLP